ncbi:MAG: WxcM-like domain-containing protein [Candidatus Cloacimonetes bacterium]|nr:WxcM-like domain-containing protein [Candidatus Cloacimonadota bacterium]
MLGGCQLINLGKIEDRRGNLTFIEGQNHIPFEIKRVFYLYDVPGGAARGGHAHKQLQQFIVPLAGSFDVRLDNGRESVVVQLNRPFIGLYVCPMVWGELSNFSSGSVCMVLASDKFDESDYYRNYTEFKAAVMV